MIYLTLTILAIPLVAMLWSMICIVRDRARLRKYHALSLLGGFLLLPLGICFIGSLEMGIDWLVSLPGVVFGSVALIGAILFVRCEALKHRDRQIPPWACPQCGYDRRGISGPCPECGSSTSPVQPA